MSINAETVAMQSLAAGMAPVALYGVSRDGQFCHCPKGGKCPSKGKHPVEKEWAAQPFPTEEEVRTIFGRHRTAQVGIRTGSVSGNLIVLDVDHGGREALAPLVHAGGGMPETLVVQTGSGGQHFYFYAPQGVEVRNSQSKVAAHVDIRGEGGQVVGPYARTNKGEYSILHSAPIAPAPQWLLDAATADRTAMPEQTPTAAPKRPQSLDEASYELNMLNKQTARLAALQNKPWEPGDAWDINCFEVACHFIELANSEWAAITHEEAHQRYMAAAPSDSQWDEREAKWTQAQQTVGEKAKAGPTGSVMDAAQRAMPDFPQGAPTAPAAKPIPAQVGRPNETDSDARMVDEFAQYALDGRAAYVAGARQWRTYRDGVWSEGSIQEIRELFRRYVLDQLDEAGSAMDVERMKLLSKYTQAGKIKSIADLSEGRTMVQAEVFDRYHDLLAVGNGTVDLQTGTLSPHAPGHYFTRKAPTAYIPDRTHSDWEEALQALPEGTAEWMQIRIGQAITGHPTWDDVLPILQGVGSNGKSSIITGLQAALGGYVGTVSERVLLAREGDHPTEMVDLMGMRMAIIEELPPNAPMNIKRLKDLLGTASIRARRMRENTVEWVATHSLFLTTNYVPKVLETDHGTWRRLALVRFPWHYVATQEDVKGPHDRVGDASLRHRLRAGTTGQHEAILAWAVEGARKWYEMGRQTPLPAPAVVEQDTNTWRIEADRIWGFLQERMEFDPDSKVSSMEMFSEFSSYLKASGAATWSDQTFATRLRDHHLAAEHRVRKVRTKALHNLSRPGEHYQEFLPGQQIMVWEGLRFRPEPVKTGIVDINEWRTH